VTTSRLKAWLDDGTDDFLWIEFEQYARRVFAHAGDDWYLDAARYAATLIQAQSVIPTRCLSVDILAPCVANLEPGPRSPDTVIDALNGDIASAFIAGVLDALLHRFSGQLDVVLKVHAPWDLLSGGERMTTIEFDSLDDVATATATVLRKFSDKPIAALLLERAEGGALSDDEVDAYEPLIGIARHYDWHTALSFAALSDGSATLDQLDVDVVLCPNTARDNLPGKSSRPCIGGGLDSNFWTAPPSPSDLTGRLLYGVIPSDAQPERVLAVLAGLGG